MLAVIKTGGKQYKVAADEIIRVEKLSADVGETVEFTPIMLMNDGQTTLGAEALAKAAVRAEVLEQGRHKKVKIMKFRRRKHHQKETGHRQYYTAVKITGIKAA